MLQLEDESLTDLWTVIYIFFSILLLWAAGMLSRNAAEEYAGGSKALNSKLAGCCTS